MKPLGLDRSFRVKHPSMVEDKLWDAVAAAIAAGWEAGRIRREVADAYHHYLKQEAELGRKEIEP